MPDVEDFLRTRPRCEPSGIADARMARLFESPPADRRWWRRPIALWQGVAAAALLGLACYGAGRYAASPRTEDAVAKETVVYIIQDTVPGTRNAFDAPTVAPGGAWWRQTAKPEPRGDAI